MYFKNRETAGKLLASQIARKYKKQDCAIIALNDGGVVVGIQIAMKLRAVIMMLATENIELPRESDPIGGIAIDGSFTYNHSYSEADLEEMTTEYYNLIEQEKMNSVSILHRKIADGVLMRRDLLEDKVVILVADGLKTGFSIDMAVKFLKPIRTKKLVIATPFASVPAVDHMHIQADEIFCMNVVKDFIDIDHYYDNPEVPEHGAVVRTIDHIVTAWK